jgi:6-phosphofructo-2-kinase/fructose-2,6-biphosphatase 4
MTDYANGTDNSHICVSLSRYLQWYEGNACCLVLCCEENGPVLTLFYRLGVKTRIFHLGDYRRATVGPGGAVPEDYFFPNATPASVILRQKILKKCREDIYAWLNHESGQVAIYDAVNPTSGGRRSLAKEFAKHDVQVSWHRSGSHI